jgi:hypothetical protein
MIASLSAVNTVRTLRDDVTWKEGGAVCWRVCCWFVRRATALRRCWQRPMQMACACMDRFVKFHGHRGPQHKL